MVSHSLFSPFWCFFSRIFRVNFQSEASFPCNWWTCLQVVLIINFKSVTFPVYSSWEVGKLQCFQWIKERFNKSNVRFCVIGDGWEECEAAQSMKWPFVKIDLQPGSPHRFPGLSLKTLGFYFSVIYGNSDSSSDEE